MRRKLILSLLILTMLLSGLATAFADNFDGNRTGSITLSLLDKGEKPIVGAEFLVCYVADVGINTDNKLNYIYSDSFKNCGVQLDDPELASKLSEYIAQEQVTAEKISTDSTGKAVLRDLPLGMYLVKQSKAASGYSLCSPFLVTVPIQDGSAFIYDVEAAPKTDIVRLVTVNIRKVWNTAQTSILPASVTVELLRDGVVVETAKLSTVNNWKVSFEELPESDAYSVREKEVPKGYTATYSKKGYDFVVYNTPSLAQTGQLIWPVPVLAVLGLLFLTLGFVILRKSGKKDA